MQQIPVFLFTGFLESGKTKFIQSIMEDKRFLEDERILLLVCEEGIEEYEPARFASDTIYMEMIEDKSELTEENLAELQRKHRATRIIIEYNGMWLLNDLFDNLPWNWGIAQEMLFFDAATFKNYNTNMRSLIVDKLTTGEVVIFNRCTEDMDLMEFHKVVRGTSRGADIAYEFTDGRTQYDDIEDPLPFDIDAPIVEIDDNDFAFFYRDVVDEMQKYEGKTIRFKGIVAKNGKMPTDTFVIGRHIMTCCEDDIKYSAFVAKYSGAMPKHKEWVTITAKVNIRFSRIYGKKGPVFMVEKLSPAEIPEKQLATFF